MNLDSHPEPDAERPGEVMLFGATGIVGTALLRQAAVRPLVVQAVTRATAPPAGLGGLARWHCGDRFELSAGAGPWPALPVVLSAGPLDAFAQWLSRAPLEGVRRVVALGSTSVLTKHDSPDAAERALSARLQDAETRLIARCEDAGIAWTLLRPTLIWGDGRDRNVSRLARLARRYRTLVLPASARGLRQPIRACDVAAAMLAAIDRPQSTGKILNLPGGETLPYVEMARRTAAAAAPGSRVLRVPDVIVRTAARWAAGLGLVEGTAGAAIARMAADLVFDPAPATAALGTTPSGFAPTAEDFGSA
jgi:nucleoside-diphosphate-sugar epimerase